MAYPNWLQLILAQLELENYVPAKIVEDYSSLFAKYIALESKQLESPQECPVASSSLIEAKEKCRILREAVKERDRTIRKITLEVSSLKESVRLAGITFEDDVALRQQKDKLIINLQNELTATQLELSAAEFRLNNTGSYIFEEKESINTASSQISETSKKLAVDEVPVLSVDSSEDFVSQSPILSFAAHQADGRCISLSSDGKLLASAGNDSLLKIWLLPLASECAPKPFQVLQPTVLPISVMSFGAHGSLLLGSEDNLVRTFSFSEKKTLQQRVIFSGHAAQLTAVFFSPNEDIAYSASFDSTIRIWKVKQERLLKVLTANSPVTDLTPTDMLSGMTSLVSAHLDGRLCLWDIQTHLLKMNVKLSEKPIVSVAMKDCETVISIARDNILRLFDLRIGSFKEMSLTRLKVPKLTKISLCPSGNYVAIGSSNGAIHLWDLRCNSSYILSGGHGSSVKSILWNHCVNGVIYSIEKHGIITLWEN